MINIIFTKRRWTQSLAEIQITKKGSLSIFYITMFKETIKEAYNAKQFVHQTKINPV